MIVSFLVEFGRSTNGNTHCEEEVADIMRNVHSNTHVSEMEAVAQPNQRQRDDMVQNQLLEILARLLQLQHQNDSLLRPVRSLQKVISLETSLVGAVREPLVHARRVEIPDRRARHDPQTEGAEDSEVHGGVRLLHEAGLFSTALDSGADRQGADQTLHAELAREGEDDGVEGDEGEVLAAFAVLRRVADVRGQGVCALVEGRVGVGEVQGWVERVVFAGGDVVRADQNDKCQQGHRPGVLERHALPSFEEALCFAPFRSLLLEAAVSACCCCSSMYLHCFLRTNIHYSEQSFRLVLSPVRPRLCLPSDRCPGWNSFSCVPRSGHSCCRFGMIDSCWDWA
jgi:hypothetical protein